MFENAECWCFFGNVLELKKLTTLESQSEANIDTRKLIFDR